MGKTARTLRRRAVPPDYPTPATVSGSPRRPGRGTVVPVNYSTDLTPQEFAELDTLVGEWTYLPDIAEAMDVQVTRVHRLMDDGSLLEVRRPEDRVRVVPAEFMDGTHPVDSLKGTVAVLRDAAFTDAQAIRWLFTEDETLPGRPIDALRRGQKTEVRRRAQALGW